MHEMWAALATAARLIATLDRDLVEIVLLSLKVNFGSVALASLIGLPLGAALALFSFVGRRTAIVIVSALMGLPPVVVGLVVYLLLSRAGPFGVFGLKALERENRDLRQVNEILRKASAYFAQAELDRRFKP